MCGRYIIFTSEEYREMKAILKEIAKHYKTGFGALAAGEIYPSNNVPAIYSRSDGITYISMQWGFELPGSKNVVINAKSETLEEKKMFKNLLHTHRCLLPANGFFEWKEKQKYLIKPVAMKTFYYPTKNTRVFRRGMNWRSSYSSSVLIMVQ